MKKVIHNNLYMLKIFFKTVPQYSFCYAFFRITRSVLFNTVGNVLFIQYIVRSVEFVIAHPEETQKIVSQLIIATCIYYGLVLLLNTIIEGIINNSLEKGAEIKIQHVFAKMMFEKSSSVDLGCYDDQKYYNNLVAANNESNTRAWNTYKNFVKLIENSAVLLSLFYIIRSLDFVVFILAVIINVLSSLFQMKLNRINGELYNKTMPYHKEIDYANRMFFLKQNAKDIRMTNIGCVLLGKLKSSSERLNEIHTAYGTKKMMLCSQDNLVKKIFGDFATLFYLAFMVLVKSAYSFDVMTALWNAYGTVKGSMNHFVNSIRELHSNSIYIEKFISFMEIENHIISKNGIILEDRTVSEKRIISEDDAASQNDTVSENDAVSEKCTISEDDAASPNDTIPEKDAVSEKRIISKDDTASPNDTIPENDTVSENCIIPENSAVSEEGLKSNTETPITIEFVDVSFSYNKKYNVLDGLNLKINANEKVAIVGNNGAGKSTFVKLLLRLYDPDKGKILVNGMDIRNYDLDFYRKNICGILVQNFQLFALSLYENVKMDIVDPKAEGLHLDNVLDMVGLSDVIGHLPDKGNSDYSREFNSSGVVFSGGQKQKLALARVLMGNKKLVILDEPSSALDPKAESDINELVLHMLPQRTVVIISHRLSTTKMADRIILIQNGKVAEDGSHKELIKNNGTYAKMFEMQSRRYKE